MFVRRVNILMVLALVAGCAPVKHVPVVITVAEISRTPLVFPMQALRQNHEGKVVVLAQIGADGIPATVVVEKSSGYRELDRAALASVRGWMFSPTTIDGVAVASYVRVPVNFDLGLQKQVAPLNPNGAPHFANPGTSTPSVPQQK